MAKVKAISAGEKAARVVRSKLTPAQKRAAVKAATKKVRTSATLDFVRSVRGG
jgi:hypothetical protein